MATTPKKPFGRYCPSCGGGHFSPSYWAACNDLHNVRNAGYWPIYRTPEWRERLNKAEALFRSLNGTELAAYKARMSSWEDRMVGLGLLSRSAKGGSRVTPLAYSQVR